MTTYRAPNSGKGKSHHDTHEPDLDDHFLGRLDRRWVEPCHQRPGARSGTSCLSLGTPTEPPRVGGERHPVVHRRPDRLGPTTRRRSRPRRPGGERCRARVLYRGGGRVHSCGANVSRCTARKYSNRRAGARPWAPPATHLISHPTLSSRNLGDDLDGHSPPPAAVDQEHSPASLGSSPAGHPETLATGSSARPAAAVQDRRDENFSCSIENFPCVWVSAAFAAASYIPWSAEIAELPSVSSEAPATRNNPSCVAASADSFHPRGRVVLGVAEAPAR